MVFNPACMNFIRSLLHFQVHGNLYTIMAEKEQKEDFIPYSVTSLRF